MGTDSFFRPSPTRLLGSGQAAAGPGDGSKRSAISPRQVPPFNRANPQLLCHPTFPSSEPLGSAPAAPDHVGCAACTWLLHLDHPHMCPLRGLSMTQVPSVRKRKEIVNAASWRRLPSCQGCPKGSGAFFCRPLQALCAITKTPVGVTYNGRKAKAAGRSSLSAEPFAVWLGGITVQEQSGYNPIKPGYAPSDVVIHTEMGEDHS